MRLFHLFVRGLDMSRFTLGKDDKEGSLYDLFAVANHSGTVNFGHYTAFGRLAETADQTIDGLKQDGLGRYNSSAVVCLCFVLMFRKAQIKYARCLI